MRRRTADEHRDCALTVVASMQHPGTLIALFVGMMANRHGTRASSVLRLGTFALHL